MRAGGSGARRPRLVWAVTAVLPACAALGLTGFKVGTLTTAQSFRGTPASVAAGRVLARHFPGGSGEPVAVIADEPSAGRLRTAIAATPGIAAVSPPVTRGGLAYLQATLASRPDSPAACAAVGRVRVAVSAVPGADAKVGGETAINLDVEHYAAHERNLIIPLVLLVVLIILGLLLRAVVAPLVLSATVVLSFAAALGLSALVFRPVRLHRRRHLDAAAGVRVPSRLGIDYNIFLMTRAREESTRSGTRQGALIALAATGGVITSAGAVLAATFAVLATLPLVILTENGCTVAIGVLLDTVIVRSVLVTTLTVDIGRRMWWPSRLAQHPPRKAPVARQATAPADPLPCREDPRLWFSELPADLERTRARRRTCPLRMLGPAGAVERAEPCGVWGGEIFSRGVITAHKKTRGR